MRKFLKASKKQPQYLDSCKTKEGEVEKVEAKEFKQSPPFPFDFGALAK